MWVMLSNSFLSIVDKAKNPGCLVVRARVAGHIEAVFPDAAVSRTPGNDYLYRAEIPRSDVASALAREAGSIDYSNFKDSVPDRRLHDAYFDVWHAMVRLQEIPPYSRG